MFKGNRKLLEDVLEGLFHIAKADRVLHPNEVQFLAQVAKRFGITETEFSYIKARHAAPTTRNPYDVLRAMPSMGNDELKSHYWPLVVEDQTDKLIASGVPKEFVAIATERSPPSTRRTARSPRSEESSALWSVQAHNKKTAANMLPSRRSPPGRQINKARYSERKGRSTRRERPEQRRLNQ